MFPVDPRDFIGPSRDGDTTTCVADNLVGTDAPGIGATFSWSLGDPFLRSWVPTLPQYIIVSPQFHFLQ